MGGRGGLDTGTNTSKMFSAVKVNYSDSSLCFGTIGIGRAFCVKRTCGVRSHADNKMPFVGLAATLVFIRMNVTSMHITFPRWWMIVYTCKIQP